MKASTKIIASPLAIALYLLLAAGCSVFYFPFAEATATCSGGKVSSDDTNLPAARDKVLADLITTTFGKPYSQYCTWYTTGGGTCTMYGMANCAMSSKSCSGNYCSNTYDQCWTCLTTARDRLVKKCGDRVSGYAVVNDPQEVFECSMQFTDSHLCSS